MDAKKTTGMYAVIRTGGKQYRVRPGDVVEVEHLSVKGEEVTFIPVLVVTEDGATIYGKDQLGQYPVTARLLGDARGDKVTVLKYRPKTGYAAKTGHRQLYSLIEIISIGAVLADRAPSQGASSGVSSDEAEAGDPEQAEAAETE